MIELDEKFDDTPPIKTTKKCDVPGAGWLNFFLFKRKEKRGDLVATISFLAFIMLITCTVLGGTELSLFGQTFKISSIDWKSSVALITVIIGYIIKSSVEQKQ